MIENPLEYPLLVTVVLAAMLSMLSTRLECNLLSGL
jgi:hypothetical protein